MDSIILFDGVCNLCNKSVDFILKRDPKGNFQFASLQSGVAAELLANNDHLLNLRTIMLLKNGNIYYRSNAILEIARELENPWPMFYIFKLVPRFIRDSIYNLISKNRYSWFGKRDTCRVPNAQEKSRFLEETPVDSKG